MVYMGCYVCRPSATWVYIGCCNESKGRARPHSAKIDALTLCKLGQLLLLVDGHRDIGPQHVVILAQEVLVVTVSQQVAGAVVEEPSDLNEQQPIGQIDAVQSPVLDMVKPEPLVDRVGLFEAGGHCLTRVQRADKSIRDDGAWNSPELCCSFGIKGT